MRSRHLLLLGFVPLILSSCCTSPKDHDVFGLGKMFTAAMEPVYNIHLMRSGAVDVIYCSASFHKMNGRFPNDYAELSEFVAQSNGYLVIGPYERVVLKPLPEDGLEICYVRPGRTNEMKITLGGASEKK